MKKKEKIIFCSALIFLINLTVPGRDLLLHCSLQYYNFLKNLINSEFIIMSSLI